MFCGICGAKAEEGDKFCIKCGAKLTQEINTETVQMPVYEMPEPPKPEEQLNTNDNASQVQKPKKSKKIFIIIGAIALFVIIFIVALVFIIKSSINKKITEAKTIDFKMEYIDIEFSGYDSVGVANVEFNDEFKDDALVALGFDEDEADSEEAKRAIMDLIYALDVDFNKKARLSNGDKVKITITADKDDLDELDVIFDEVTIEVTVTGLEKSNEMNPFDYLTVITEGFDGNVTVKWEYTGDNEFINTYSFDCSDCWNLSIGDTITITFDEYDQEYLLGQQGIILTQTEMTYTVKDADKYISEYDDIDADIIKEIKKMCETEIEDKYDMAYVSFELESYEYYGAYLLTNKSVIGNKSVLYMIYKGTIVSKNDDFDPVTVYIPVSTYDLIQRVDGTQEFDNRAYVDLQFSYVNGEFGNYVYGYLSEKDLFEEKCNFDDYTVDLAGKVIDFRYADEEETTEETTEKDTEGETTEQEETTAETDE